MAGTWRGRYRPAWLLALAALLLVRVLAGVGLALDIHAVRVSEVDDTEVVLETSRAVSFDARIRPNPLRLELEIPRPGVRLRARRASGVAMLLGAMRSVRLKRGVRLIFPLNAPALISDAHAERRDGALPARLVVRLRRTDWATLERLLGIRIEDAAAASSIPTPPRPARSQPRMNDDSLAKMRKAYRRLIEKAASTPATIDDLIAASPLPVAPVPPKRTGSAPPKRHGAPLIVVDAGHGGKDPGAMDGRGHREKDIVLQFARALRDALRRRGYRVIMTRDGDTFLQLKERSAVARRHHAALFISIHADKFRQRNVGGLGIYTLSEEASDEDAAELARMENAADLIGAPVQGVEDETVRDILVQLTQRETNVNSHILARQLVRALRGVARLRRNPVRSAAFRVLRLPEIPSLLVELGYVTNPTDVRNMLSPAWRRKVAARMAGAIDRFLKTRVAQR